MERRDEFACHDEGFLVGQSDGSPGFDGLYGRAQAGKSDHGGQYDVGLRAGGNLANGLRAGTNFYGNIADKFAQRLALRFVGDDRDLRAELPHLFGQAFHAVIGHQRVDPETVGVLADHIERLRADGAGRAEQGD